MGSDSLSVRERATNVRIALSHFVDIVRPNWFQFALNIFLVVLIGAIAAICKLTQGYMTYVDTNENGVQDWETEKGEFLVDGTLRSTQFLVAFGVSKAVANLFAGIASDVYGRKPVMIAGWVLAIAIPLMVMLASSWDVIVASNVFLGVQQGWCWSLTIFLMADYAGAANRGLAVGINETVGYVSIAVFSKIAASVINEESLADTNYRTDPYYIVIAMVAAGLLLSLFVLRDTKKLVQLEDKNARSDALNLVSIAWPSGARREVSVIRMAFVETSFLNGSLIACCQAGLMINFTTAFAWGIMTKWLKTYGNAPHWNAFDKDTAADIIFAYGITKGIMQFFFGFCSDRLGRRLPIVGGLCTVCVSMLIFYAIGKEVVGQENAKRSFTFAAFLLGFGTSMMYPNLIAAACDHSDPSWRASAMGTYRFWRDSGYWVGGLTLGAIADATSVTSAIMTMAVLCACSAMVFWMAYEEKVRAPVETVVTTLSNREVGEACC